MIEFTTTIIVVPLNNRKVESLKLFINQKYKNGSYWYIKYGLRKETFLWKYK